MEAAFSGVALALRSCKLPKVIIETEVSAGDGAESRPPSVSFSPNPEDSTSLDIKAFPSLRSHALIGSHSIADPTIEEEEVADSIIHYTHDPSGNIINFRKYKNGLFSLSEVFKNKSH